MRVADATTPRAVRVTERIWISALAFGVSCIAGVLLLWTVFSFYDNPWSTDASTAYLLAPIGVLWFAGPVWLLVMLPISTLVPANARVCSSSIAPLFGAAGGALAVAVEVVVSDPPETIWDLFTGGWFHLSCGALMGTVVWTCFSMWLRRSARATPTSRGKLARRRVD